MSLWAPLGAQMIKNPLAIWEDLGSIPGLGSSLEREWLPTPVSLPGESQGQRSLVGYSPWRHKEWDMSERLNTTTTHISV